MTIDEIKELLDLFNESGVGEIEVQRGEDRVRIRKALPPGMLSMPGGFRPAAQEYVAGGPGTTVGPVPPAMPPPQPNPNLGASLAAAAASAPEQELNHTLVRSPIVGTYYDQPAPGAECFVKVGDSVEPGQVLCIIESMKLMNEIEAEIAGTVAAKLVENGRPVEYGEALLAIRPR